MVRNTLRMLGFGWVMLVAIDARAGEIFVSGTGSDSNDGMSAAKPLRNLQTAADRSAAGDTVIVDDGVYGRIIFKSSGTANAWIRFVAKAGAKPKVQFTGWDGIYFGAVHYIEFRGFEIIGPMAMRTLAQCTADADAAMPDVLCNASGIAVEGKNLGSARPHHILIAENDVHDCPAGGIGAREADYITIEDNYVHDNSWHTRSASSGIGLVNSWDSDTFTGVKMIIRRNRLFNNKTLVKWSAKVPPGLSDGNGIIIDTSKNNQPNAPIPAYKGRTLVENNLSVANGGSGIHTIESEHVTIAHNTAYQNGQVVGYADIFASYSNDVQILDNIMYARAAGAVNTKDTQSTAITYDYNLYFGGKVASMGAHDVVADPLFVKASLDPLGADFTLLAKSPAVDTGMTPDSTVDDLRRGKRPIGMATDRGAYEFGSATGSAGLDAGVSGEQTDGDGGSGAYDLGGASSPGTAGATPDLASPTTGNGEKSGPSGRAHGCSIDPGAALPGDATAIELMCIAGVMLALRTRTRRRS